MSRQVIWTTETLEFFISHANLTELEEKVMRSRADERPRSWQKEHYHISMSTLDRTIKRLKKKYDVTQAQFPDKLPVRKNSAKELYMDTH